MEKPYAEVAELEDALDSKSSGASPRAGSIPAFGIDCRFGIRVPVTKETFPGTRS
jgi:hypothetical protein